MRAAELSVPPAGATQLEAGPASPVEKATPPSGGAANVPDLWAVGDRVLGLYEVRQVHGQGGMGLVYRVRHLGWNVDLAVKSPRPELFADEPDKERFTREAETWVSLGVHPHLCSCHYVRTLGGIPRVFAEYVEGGSLREWIDDRRLYQGGPTEALARILDIAVQVAWGLEHAHGRGVVHQDVKPANVLLDGEGTAKVTDFGLARTRGLTARPQPGAAEGGSVLVTSGGMTPAYASPEQAAGAAVGRRSDVWSFAVTVLEMFTGEVTWLAGPAAGAALADYRTRSPADPAMPPQLADLLARCLRNDPAGRPASMAEVAVELAEVYRQELGRAFPRAAPRAAELRADELTNRALSMLDLGRGEEAERFFDEALAADPQHLEATYNTGLLGWRAGKITDDMLLARLEAVRASAPDSGPAQRLLAQVHLERGDIDSALPLLEEAARRTPDDTEIHTAIHRARAGGATGRYLNTLLKDTVAVFSVCVSADGRLALFGIDSIRIWVWDLATGRCLRTLKGEISSVHSVCVSADGHLAVSADDLSGVRVWDLAAGRCLRTLEGHIGNVSSVHLSADGRFFLSGGSHDKTARVWDLATGRCLHTLEGHIGGVSSVCLSTDGSFALSGSHDGTVRVWDLATGRCLRTLEGHIGGVSSVCLSTDGSFALSGSHDGTVRVWDLATGRCLRTLEGHIGYVYSVCVSADGHLAISAGHDGTVRVWDLATSRCLRTLEGHIGHVYSVCVSADGNFALSGSRDGTVRMWELPSMNAVDVCSLQPCRPRSHAELARHETQLEKLLNVAKFSLAKGRFSTVLALLQEARAIPGRERDPKVLEAWRELSPFSVRTGIRGAWQSKILTRNIGSVYSVCVSADGYFALSGGEDRTVRVWELATGRHLHTLQGHTRGVDSVCVSADGRYVLSADFGGMVRVWELATGRCLHTLTIGSSLCVSADGRFVLSSRGEQVRVSELATGRCLRTLEGPTGWVAGGAKLVWWSADERYVISGRLYWEQSAAPDRAQPKKMEAIRVWELTTGRCLHTLTLRSPLCVSADGHLAISAGYNGMRVWDLATGRCLRTLEGHRSYMNSACVSADGRYVLSAGSDGMVRVWELATGRHLHTFQGHTDAVDSVCMSADGRFVLSGSWDGTVRVWEIDWELEARDPADWDEGARPHLETFLTLHTPVAGTLPPQGDVSEQQIQLALSRRGRPSWTDTDVDDLLRQLQYAGYGWLRKEGVIAELERMARGWKAPPLPYQ